MLKRGGEGGAAGAQFGGIKDGERDVQGGQVHGDEVEAVAAGGEDALGGTVGFDDGDGGWDLGGDGFGGGVDPHPGTPAVRA